MRQKANCWDLCFATNDRMIITCYLDVGRDLFNVTDFSSKVVEITAWILDPGTSSGWRFKQIAIPRTSFWIYFRISLLLTCHLDVMRDLFNRTDFSSKVVEMTAWILDPETSSGWRYKQIAIPRTSFWIYFRISLLLTCHLDVMRDLFNRTDFSSKVVEMTAWILDPETSSGWRYKQIAIPRTSFWIYFRISLLLTCHLDVMRDLFNRTDFSSKVVEMTAWILDPETSSGWRYKQIAIPRTSFWIYFRISLLLTCHLDVMRDLFNRTDFSSKVVEMTAWILDPETSSGWRYKQIAIPRTSFWIYFRISLLLTCYLDVRRDLFNWTDFSSKVVEMTD